MKRKTRLVGLILTMLVATIALPGCAGDKSETVSSNDSITIGISQDVDSLDPIVADGAGTREVLFNIYEGLVKYDNEGNLNPAVASGVDISDDGKTYTITLREGVKFHDGSLVTAEDVLYSLNKGADADSNSKYAAAFSIVESIEKKSDSVIEIVLSESNNEFLSNLTMAIVPEHVEDINVNPIGTGPYKIAFRVPQESIGLEAFEDYYGDKAHIKNITLKICSNADSIVMDLLGGSVDLFCRIPEEQVAQLENSDFEVLEGTMNLVQALYLNNDVEPFNDPRVRQALCYAVDKDEIMEFVSGGKGTELSSSVFPAFGKYYDASLNENYKTDLEKAKELLSEAGYPDGISFTITVPNNYKQHIDTAEVLAEQFKRIGVTANIELIEWESWLNDVYCNREFQTTVVGVDASVLTASALLQRFTSDNEKNFINYSNEAYDEAFENALHTYDDEQQTAYYKECLEILSNDAANVYIQDLPTFVAIRNTIGGYKFYPLYVQDFASLYFK